MEYRILPIGAGLRREFQCDAEVLRDVALVVQKKLTDILFETRSLKRRSQRRLSLVRRGADCYENLSMRKDAARFDRLDLTFDLARDRPPDFQRLLADVRALKALLNLFFQLSSVLQNAGACLLFKLSRAVKNIHAELLVS